MTDELRAFGETCWRELTENIVPFWLEHGWDREHGGVFTCLDRDGSLMDPTKSVWFQGRFAYVLSYAANFFSGLSRPSCPSSHLQGVAGEQEGLEGQGGLERCVGNERQKMADWLAAAK